MNPRTWKQLLLAGALALASLPAAAMECADLGWFGKGCNRVLDTWQRGGAELYLPGYAYHHRGSYDAERLKELNEEAYGLGFGRGVEDADGDSHSLFGMVIRDSHKKAQMMAGYSYQTYGHLGGEFKAGIGYTVFLVSRPDIYGSVPIPGILPLVSLKYRQTSLMGAAIPSLSEGTTGNGNVVFVFIRQGF